MLSYINKIANVVRVVFDTFNKKYSQFCENVIWKGKKSKVKIKQ